MFKRPTIAELRDALKALETIPRPDGDNEGDPIDSETVYPHLAPLHQKAVEQAKELLHQYTRRSDGEVDRRAVSTLNKNGLTTSLNPSQYDAYRLVGDVTVGEWTIDISDAGADGDDDE